MKSTFKKNKKSIKLNKKRERGIKDEPDESNKIVIKKKEIFNILNDIKLDNNLVIIKKSSEESNSLNNNNSIHSNNVKEESNSSIQAVEKNKKESEILIDAGSGAVKEKDELIIKEEDNNSQPSILSMILTEIQQCQFSEIFKIFTKEINNQFTEDYFIKMKEFLINYDKEKLINSLAFLVWSLRFMKVDNNLIRNGINLIVSQNSFSINKDNLLDYLEEKNLNSLNTCDQLYSPNFNHNNNNINNYTSNYQTFGIEKQNFPNNSNNSNLNNFMPYPYVLPNQFTMPNNYFIPVGYMPSLPMSINSNTLNQSNNILSSMNNSSFFKTEVIKSGQLFNNFTIENINSNKTHNDLLNESYGTVSSIKRNKNKDDIELIDITIGEHKYKEKDFEKVYGEIIKVFSKPINDETFIRLKTFMKENQVIKIEELIRNNTFPTLEKTQYILLFKTTKDELYLKIDPKLKKYSITKVQIRKDSKNKLTEK